MLQALRRSASSSAAASYRNTNTTHHHYIRYHHLLLDRCSPSIPCAQRSPSGHTYSAHAPAGSTSSAAGTSTKSYPLQTRSRPALRLAPSMATMTYTQTQTRSHAGHAHGHGHGHSHSHDNVYLTSTNKNDAGVRITRIGLFVNLGMAIAKGVGGWLFHSQALVADAFHALTDLVSDFMTLATISWSLKPPSERFPYGYGKIESLGALGVSGLLVFGGIGMGLSGLDALYLQLFADTTHGDHVHGLFGGFGHSHSHSHDAHGPNINAAWLAAGSIVVKEWLYRATMKIAQERKSSVLASNAVHHRIDSLTSVVALLTIGGSHVFTDASWLDPVGGLIISAMVIKAGWGNTMSALLELADVTVDEDIKTSVRTAATKALKGDAAKGIAAVRSGDLVEIKDIQGIKSGQNYLVDIELVVPSTLTVASSNLIEQAVRERTGSKVRGVRRVRVRFTTREDQQDFRSEFIDADVSPRSSPEPEDEHSHDHRHTLSNGHALQHKKTR